jgi:hypothetical protein
VLECGCDLGGRPIKWYVPGYRKSAQIDGSHGSAVLVGDKSIAPEAFLGAGAGSRQRQCQKGTAGDHLFQSSALKTKNLARV